jgi:TonB family protein
MVTVDGRARLLDFGVARDLREDSSPALQGLTPEYASPAVLAGAAPEPTDDLFALACVAYRMLAGQRPFGDCSPAEAAGRELQAAPVETLTPGQWRALERALALDARRRPADLGQFLAEFKGPRDEPPPPATADRTAPGAGRNIWLAAAAGLAAVAVLAGWLLAPRGEPDTAGSLTAAADDPLAAAVTDADPLVPAAAAAVRPELPAQAGAARSGAVVRPESPARAAATIDSRRAESRRTDRPRAEAQPAAPRETRTAQQRAAAPVAAAPPRAAATLAALDAGAVIGQDRGVPALPPPTEADPDQAGSGSIAEPPSAATERPLSALGLKRYFEAEYPRTAAAKGAGGWVEIGFRIDADGRPQDLRVVAADPAGVFDAAALTAVRRWRFARPAAGDEPRTRVRVRFNPAG